MNTTTLNMTTLDGGNVIIKRGESGGSTPPSGGESGGSTFEYLDITNVTGMGGQLKFLLLQLSYMCKIPQSALIKDPNNAESSVTIHQGVAPSSGWVGASVKFDPGTEAFRLALDAVSAMSINFSDTINMRGQVMTIGETFAMYGVQAEIDAIPRPTKEQFYTLD